METFLWFLLSVCALLVVVVVLLVIDAAAKQWALDRMRRRMAAQGREMNKLRRALALLLPPDAHPTPYRFSEAEEQKVKARLRIDAGDPAVDEVEDEEHEACPPNALGFSREARGQVPRTAGAAGWRRRGSTRRRVVSPDASLWVIADEERHGDVLGTGLASRIVVLSPGDVLPYAVTTAISLLSQNIVAVRAPVAMESLEIMNMGTHRVALCRSHYSRPTSIDPSARIGAAPKAVSGSTRSMMFAAVAHMRRPRHEGQNPRPLQLPWAASKVAPPALLRAQAQREYARPGPWLGL
jgi:hypothetical protein